MNGVRAHSEQVTVQQPRWQLLIQEASAMARRGVGTRRASRELLRQVADDRVALETASEHFVARLAEGDDACAERALAYLEAAMASRTGITARHPLRSISSRR
jgi:hypothetical protein